MFLQYTLLSVARVQLCVLACTAASDSLISMTRNLFELVSKWNEPVL